MKKKIYLSGCYCFVKIISETHCITSKLSAYFDLSNENFSTYHFNRNEIRNTVFTNFRFRLASFTKKIASKVSEWFTIFRLRFFRARLYDEPNFVGVFACKRQWLLINGVNFCLLFHLLFSGLSFVLLKLS